MKHENRFFGKFNGWKGSGKGERRVGARGLQVRGFGYSDCAGLHALFSECYNGCWPTNRGADGLACGSLSVTTTDTARQLSCLGGGFEGAQGQGGGARRSIHLLCHKCFCRSGGHHEPVSYLRLHRGIDARATVAHGARRQWTHSSNYRSSRKGREDFEATHRPEHCGVESTNVECQYRRRGKPGVELEDGSGGESPHCRARQPGVVPDELPE